MTQIERGKIEREARRAAVERSQPSRFTNALSSYLTAYGYAATAPPRGAEPSAPPRAAEPSAPPPAPAPVVGADGVRAAHTPTVVVAVDPSPGSYTAVDHAAIEADLRGWEVRLVHVQPHVLGRRSLSQHRDQGAELLAELGERVRSRVPTLPVATALRIGSPGDILVDESATAGLTVVGNRGHGSVTGVLTGSLSLHLAERAVGPVLVVRVPAWPPGPGWSERPVVVGVDGSAGGDAALEFGLAEARLRGSELVVVHAGSGEAASALLASGPLAGGDEEVAGVTVHRRLVDGAPTDALVEASVHAAAVVVGARGHGALAGLVLGSVGKVLINRAHCPVFVVHPEATTHV